MGHWTDKELIDAPVELLDEKDIVRQRKLQERRAKKLAKQDQEKEKAKEKASSRLIAAVRGKKKGKSDPFSDFNISGAEHSF
eukprot:CAMPEP_0117028270 /NCGR_PEP_ID=MMETSP0472-20121206/20570_1 /TAXON_ID=693140 ORGANISM="Tiarina fusus, Strain LIS" /NCGR_SAMPLE_ID=MMETSP0472 /ASSEMBLY_ACC=CAM_ASM_000603 /LENGTH=81 /DNA_ID=CAMNT_0004735711 /DNA_START=23 /DNA_END=268 /DNA_ORIENTATION=+